MKLIVRPYNEDVEMSECTIDVDPHGEIDHIIALASL
jgi:hypothetical protein